jgi:hypothetical protein
MTCLKVVIWFLVEDVGGSSMQIELASMRMFAEHREFRSVIRNNNTKSR